MSRKTLSPASVFERVLRAHETGGVTFKDVRSQLKELLAAGASPTELLETLRRQEQWEPLPESARVEVVGLIDEAIRTAPKNDDAVSTVHTGSDSTSPASADAVAAAGNELDKAGLPLEQITSSRRSVPSENVRSLEARIAGQQADYTSLTRAYERAREAESAANTRVTALAAQVSELQTARDADEAKAQRVAVSLSEALAANEALHERAETAVREARDARSELRALSESVQARDAALAEVRKSLSKRDAELAAQSRHTAQSAEQSQQEIRGLRDSLKTAEASILELQQSALVDAQRVADERAVELEQLRQQSARMESDLQSARSALAVANRSQGEREAQREAQLQAVRAALVAEQAERQHAAQAAEVAQRSADARTAELGVLQQQSAEREAQHDAELQTLRAALVAEQAALVAEQAALTDADRSVGERETALESDLQATRAALATLQTENAAELQSARAALDAERIRAQEMDRAFAERLESTDAARARAAQQLSDEQRQNVELRRALESLTTELAKLKSASTVAAESVPLVTPAPIPLLVSAFPKSIEPAASAARATRPNRLRIIGAIAAIFLCVVAAYVLSHRTPSAGSIAVKAAPVPLPKVGTVIRDCLTCPEITVLPTGKFQQGSAGQGVGPAAFEKPLHVVTIDRVIGMATNLVTVDEFQQFVTASGWESQGCTIYDGEWKARPKNNWSNPGFVQTGKHPVTCASWNDAQAYAKWLSAKTGHAYRLPSASEWEYAARAGSEAAAPWTTESAACAHANVADSSAAHRYPGWAVFNCEDGYVYTSPVGSFKANAFGLNDMLGNVFQWTEDCWHPNYVGAPSDGKARTDGSCDEHELRGGSWFTTPAFVRANYRNHFTADYRSSTVGIRLVRDFGA